MSEDASQYGKETKDRIQGSKMERLYDACQAIIDESNFDDIEASGYALISSESIIRMASALHAIRRPIPREKKKNGRSNYRSD